jgi:putative DNA primase/helicase
VTTTVVDCLTVPLLAGDTDVLSAALAYAECGWYVLPIRRRTKHPGSVVGAEWQHRSSRDPGQLVAWLAGTDHGISLHTGRSGAVVFDVDTPSALPDVLTRHLNDVPYQSTRGDDPARGHYVFAVPPGRQLGNGTGALAGKWGEVRGGNGIIVAAPSLHSHPAGRYRWIRCGPLPQLPEELAVMLPEGKPGETTASDAVVRSFLAEHTAASNPRLLSAVLSWLASELAAGASRHAAVVSAACWAMREAAAGYYPATDAADQLRAAFLAAVATARPGSTRPAGDPLAPAEWTSILAWAVAQARATDPATTRERVASRTDPTWLGAAAARNQMTDNDSSGDHPHEGRDGGGQYGPSPTAPPPEPSRLRHRTRDDFSDAYMAQTVADEVLDGRFVWCKGLGWLRWNGQRWEEATEETVGEALRVYVLDRFAEAVTAVREGTAVGAVAIDGWRLMLSAGRQRGVLVLARGIVEHRAEQFDADPEVLNSPCGIVNLVTGVVSPHDPKKLLTKITRGSYRPGFTHPDWCSALAALPADKALWYQARIGQAITGYPTPDGVLVLLQGGGENGKSLLSTDGLLPALGDYADVASAKLITATRGSEHSTERADLRGKRLLVAEEMTEGRALDITAIKQIQDVTQIKARYVHRDNITFPASHSLFATTNYVPRVDETDHGTWRRLALLRFPYTFRKPAEPLDSPCDRRGDPELKAKIRTGATGQRDAIVTWAVEGALRVANQGTQALAVPASVDADTRAWRAVTDRILGYWTERLIPAHGCCVLASELLEDFNDWLQSNGHQAWSKETFTPKFESHAETSRHRVELRRQLHPTGLIRRSCLTEKPIPARVRVWHGVRYCTPSDQQEDDTLPEVAHTSGNLPPA